MYSNNLNGAYEYESERRNDERRAAAESQMLHGIGDKQKAQISPRFVLMLVTLLIVLWHVF